MSDNSSVQVAVRVRPLAPYEIAKGCKEAIDVIQENEQIFVRPTEKAFTFNYVLDTNATQEVTYTRCVQGMIRNLFNGYNVTILAYGQTGSGKTHTMGTSYKEGEDMGVIPRAVNDIFDYVRDHFTMDFTINVSFIELYKEVLYDLLSEKPRDQCILDIREDTVKGNHIPGMTEITVTNPIEVFDTLAKGSLGRATASTNMNSQSSRSHAIFTINICMQSKEDCKINKTAKLHLVDLAGSERPKKTGAVGNTFREGVNINKGLFVLGNVISCLGDEKNQSTFIPYRDSNLTRLLKDSLGGNSITLMIACISPADYNVEETSSTLRYADRAKRIKNKPIVNEDSKVAEINNLKKTVQQLRLQILGQGGPAICPAEIELYKKENNELKCQLREKKMQLSVSLMEKASLLEKLLLLQSTNESLNKKLSDLGQDFEQTFSNLSAVIEKTDPEKFNQLQEIQNKFLEISSDHKKAETEIKNHDNIYAKQLWNSTEESPSDTQSDVHEQQDALTVKQIALNSELQEITRQLALKEGLAQQLMSNAQCMVDYTAMAQHEEKIASLQKEKDELLQQLKNAHSQEISGKLAEQRRKRVKELEGQIHDLHKKLQEQSRLIKLKEKDELRIKQLNNEIVQMKQARVKLIKSMREESEKFRTWKMQREREVAKLKQQDRKKENEIAKMKVMNAKQQNVLKRKVEEANALNKRLQLSLQLRKQAQDMKNKGDKVGAWIKQELDVFLNLVEVEETLAMLLEDRATLQHQLDALKNDSNTKDSEQCKIIQEDIECRSAQIQDLQQKILESDEDNKVKLKFENVQTMNEAKQAFKLLIELISDLKRKSVQTQSKLTEFQEANLDRKKNYEECLKTLKKEVNEQISELQNSYEEKIAVLLRELLLLRGGKTGDGDGPMNADMKNIIEEEYEKMRIQSQEQQKRITELEAKLEQISAAAQNCTTPTIQTKESKRSLKKPKTVPTTTFMIDDDEDEKENVIDEDDDVNDPDWRKTPLGKRLLLERQKLNQFKTSSLGTSTLEDLRPTVKRSSEGGCTCKTTCSTTRCGCKKMSRNCGPSCKCKIEMCNNKKSENDNEELCDSSDESFKKPRVEPLDKQTKRSLFDNSD